MAAQQTLAVYGLARSGLSVIKALHKTHEIFAWDDDPLRREEALTFGCKVEAFSDTILKRCGLLVLSPGIPLTHEVVKCAQEAGLEIVCDIELYFRLHPGLRSVGVTGTNGKSTTTALIAHVLQSAHKTAVMAGNIGKPIFDVAPDPNSIMVLELSSYQLDLCPAFRPDIAVLLNISPDHLDRHGSMDNYAAAKARIFDRPDSIAVVGVDDAWSRSIAGRIAARQIHRISMDDKMLKATMAGAILKGDHNYQNALAAYWACRSLDVEEDDIFEGLRNFPGLNHRQFTVRAIGAATYINDSKATNAASAARALASYKNIYWIAGGLAKDGGWDELEDKVSEVSRAYLIGAAANNFALWMAKRGLNFTISETLDRAVAAAHADAQNSGRPATVLLSPACASFDQFKSFEERGDVFTTLVRDLT